MPKTVPPALSRAHELLHQEMLGYLDEVELLTSEADTEDETILDVARTEVPRLVAAVRGMLRDHRADVFGLCLGCAPTWVDGHFAREPWPCPVVGGAHEYLRRPEKLYER
ncbi:hypothetical protein [Saccharothrix coeruleofusca]|uniref:Uncharacterized protein n=1 Tax=Saccharothrix coeruleofusca TaxID=33919 RepID=A0A918ECG9_9PSEU|nr:hypothetical protein [Saccharothrix coeruleofusca]MBP2338362.1 hypothetical protein [Saccharothrix coeruleofusca]GGP48869.1 hypothetical protein GCM10010185_21220 [Saccharothrix coeruleofusca]